MNERRRIKHADRLKVQMEAEAKKLREQAERLGPGLEREELLRQARQAETGSRLNEWLNSPGLQPPE